MLNFFGVSLHNCEKSVKSKLVRLKKLNFFSEKFLNKLIKELTIYNFLTNRLNIVLKSKSFKLNSKIYNKFNIKKLDEKYKNL